MLQDMDHQEASCVLYVKVVKLDKLEQRKFCALTVNRLGIVSITVHNDLILCVSFMHDPGDLFRQKSPDILCSAECQVYM